MDRRRVLLLLLGAGCGRIGFDGLRGDGGPAGDGIAVDGTGDAAPLGLFGTPTNVTELNLPGVNSEDPTLTDDVLEIVFSSTRPAGLGGVDLWTATRPAPTGSWGAPVLVPNVNSTSDDTTPEISGDGLALVFASSRPGGSGLYDLYLATRVVRGAAWSAPVRVVELASAADEFAGSLAPDRLSIVFSSSRIGGMGGADLYEAARVSPDGGWKAPTLIASLGSTADDSSPWVSGDGQTTFFGSTRPGGQGDQDLWTSSRATRLAPWSPPVTVSELNDASYNSDPWLSPDLRTIFHSRLEGAVRNVFVSTR